MANQKAPINQLEQRTMLNGAPIRADIKPVVNPALGEMARMSADLGNILQKQQERNDRIKLNGFEAELRQEENMLLKEISLAKTAEDIDALYNDYESKITQISKDKLGARLSNTWKRENDYFAVTKKIMDSAKFDLNQKEANIALENNLDLYARNFALAQDKEEKQSILNIAQMDISNAFNPENGGVPIGDISSENKVKREFWNKIDVYSVKEQGQINARDTLERLNRGEFKNLTAEQINDFRGSLEKLSNEQEQDALYKTAVSKFTDKSGKTDFYSAEHWLINEAAKTFPEVKSKNIKAASDILQAVISKNERLEEKAKEERESAALNEIFAAANAGDVDKAVNMVYASILPEETKYKIVENIKKRGGSSAKNDDAETYNSLTRGIVDGDIYNQNPILEALAEGKIKETTKDAMLQLLKQKQEPSFNVYKRAVTQVSKVFDKGLMGALTPAESASMTNILRELETMYSEALAANKSEEEIKEIFSPENVNEVAFSMSAGVQEAGESFLSRFTSKGDKKKNGSKSLKAVAMPNESIADFDKRMGWSFKKDENPNAEEGEI